MTQTDDYEIAVLETDGTVSDEPVEATAGVDGDGKDEIVYGSCVIDHDGTGLYSTGWNHSDALHVSDFDPSRDGLEVFQPHESGPYG